MVIPKLKYIFIYSCSGKYPKKNLRNFIKHIKVNYVTGEFIWTGHRDKKGYGKFSIGRKSYLAHRAAYEMATGILIPDGKVVMHKNDNPPDVNPDHLQVGTTQENTADMINKGRQVSRVGELAGNSKLTWIHVKEIRRLYATGKYTYKQLSKIFEVNDRNISNIINNKSWYDSNYIPNKTIDHTKKLTQEQKIEINRLYITDKYSHRQLGMIFGVAHSTIRYIINESITNM
jgi:hypothetical protein